MEIKSIGSPMMRGLVAFKTLYIFLYFADRFVSCFPRTVIYETDEPKTFHANHPVLKNNGKHSTISEEKNAENDLIKIKTNNFLINVSNHDKSHPKSVIKEIEGSKYVIKLGKPLVFDENPVELYTGKGNIPPNARETLKAALVGVIIDKLRQSSDSNVKMKNFVSNNSPLHTMRESSPRSHDVTDMFVSFLEDMSKRLDLDVVTVAEQLISRSTQRSEDMGMTTGYARNTIPSIPAQFKPIIKFISYLVNKELKSARLLS